MPRRPRALASLPGVTVADSQGRRYRAVPLRQRPDWAFIRVADATPLTPIASYSLTGGLAALATVALALDRGSLPPAAALEALCDFAEYVTDLRDIGIDVHERRLARPRLEWSTPADGDAG